MAAKLKDLKAAGVGGQPVASREEAHGVAAAIMGEAGGRSDAQAHREAPKQAPYVSKRTFDYFGQSIDRGQIFRFRGGPHDRQLIDLGYCALMDVGASLYACNACGAEFTDLGLRDGHGKARHQPKIFVPPSAPQRDLGESIDQYQNRLDEWSKQVGAMADAQDDQRARHEDEVAPLDLTRTQASREA